MRSRVAMMMMMVVVVVVVVMVTTTTTTMMMMMMMMTTTTTTTMVMTMMMMITSSAVTDGVAEDGFLVRSGEGGPDSFSRGVVCVVCVDGADFFPRPAAGAVVGNKMGAFFILGLVVG